MEKEKMEMKRNKKGNSSLELLVILVVLVVLGISFPIIYVQISPILTNLANALGGNSATILNDFNSKFPTMLDNMYIIVFIFLWIGAVLLSIFVDTHPAFLMISWVLVLIILWTSLFIGNFMEQFSNQDFLTLSRQNMPKIYFISTHILEIMVVMGFSILLALYGKNRGASGGF